MLGGGFEHADFQSAAACLRTDNGDCLNQTAQTDNQVGFEWNPTIGQLGQQWIGFLAQDRNYVGSNGHPRTSYGYKSIVVEHKQPFGAGGKDLQGATLGRTIRYRMGLDPFPRLIQTWFVDETPEEDIAVVNAGAADPNCSDCLINRGHCVGGADAGQICQSDADCSGSTCGPFNVLYFNPTQPGIYNFSFKGTDKGTPAHPEYALSGFGRMSIIVTDCPVASPLCGDGVFNHPCERCDDGNRTNGDGCDSNCGWEPGYLEQAIQFGGTVVLPEGQLSGDLLMAVNGTILQGDGFAATTRITGARHEFSGDAIQVSDLLLEGPLTVTGNGVSLDRIRIEGPDAAYEYGSADQVLDIPNEPGKMLGIKVKGDHVQMKGVEMATSVLWVEGNGFVAEDFTMSGSIYLTRNGARLTNGTIAGDVFILGMGNKLENCKITGGRIHDLGNGNSIR